MKLIPGSIFRFKRDVFDCNRSDCCSSSSPVQGPCHGPDDQLLVQGLHGAHLRAKKACRQLVGPCLILSISFVVAAIIAGFSTIPALLNNVLASVLWMSAFGSSFVAMVANHRGHLHHISQEAVRNFFEIQPDGGFPVIRHHRLLAKLGLSSTNYQGDLITTAFYLGLDERDQKLGIVTFSKSLDDHSYFDQSMPLANFVMLVFARGKAEWRFADDKFEAAYRGFRPQINGFVKSSLVEHLPVEAFASIKSLLSQDGVLLRTLLQKRPYDLDLLPEVGETQLLVWCKQNLPSKGWRRWLYRKIFRKNTSVHRLVSAMDDNDLLTKVIPTALLERAVDYCLTPKGAEHLRSFTNWLWYISPTSPASLPRPEYTHIQNAWMLRTVSSASVFRSINTLYKTLPDYFDVYKDAVRKIIDSVGLDPNASLDGECYQGYRNLYGLEATLRRYPESSRFLLQNDLNI